MSYRWQEQDFKWKPPSSWKSHQLDSTPSDFHSNNQLSNNTSNYHSPMCSASGHMSEYTDQLMVNIETSIPILHTAGILKVIQSIEAAKAKLQEGHLSDRLTAEARFLYCMWKMIDEEEIETRQLKEIIYLMTALSIEELGKYLRQIYGEEAVQEFISTWKAIRCDKRVEQPKGKSMTKLSSNKEKKQQVKNTYIIKKPLNQSGQSILSQSQQICCHFLKQKPICSQLQTMQSVDFGMRNKQNNNLAKSRQKQMINRLYKNDKYQQRAVLKRIDEERRRKLQMEGCTFKPELNERNRSFSCRSRSKSVNGYDKAVMRLKVGRKKTTQQKQRMEYKPVGENYHKLRGMKANPPSFLERSRGEQKVQFVIEFDLGRRRVKVRVREGDVEEQIASSLCKIYTLKNSYFEQICGIIRKEREIYEIEQAESEKKHEDVDQYDY